MNRENIFLGLASLCRCITYPDQLAPQKDEGAAPDGHELFK